MSVVLGLLAAVATSATVLAVLTAVVVADPDRPGRLGALAVSSPVVSEEAVDYLADVLRDQGLARGADDAQIRRATEVALADPEVREALADLEITDDGRIRLDDVYEAAADRLQEEGRDQEAGQLRELSQGAETSVSVGDQLGRAAGVARGGLLAAALVTGIIALVAGGIAMAVARRTVLCLGGIILVAGLISALALEVLPAVTSAAAEGVGWTAAMGSLAGLLGTAGTIAVAVMVVLGGLLAALGAFAGRATTK